jgi:hypothetical protein
MEDDFETTFKRKVTEIFERTSKYRGDIINEAINTETYIEFIVSYHFTNGDKKKARELRHTLLSTHMFSANTKKNMFLFILKNYYPKIKIDGSDLDRIMKIRNQMAHGKYVFIENNLVDQVLKFDGETVLLHEWKTEDNKTVSRPIKLTQKSIEVELTHINKVNTKLIAFMKEVMKIKK